MAETDIVDPDMVAPLLRKMRSPLAGVAADALERQAAEIARLTARVAELEEPAAACRHIREAAHGLELLKGVDDRVLGWIEVLTGWVEVRIYNTADDTRTLRAVSWRELEQCALNPLLMHMDAMLHRLGIELPDGWSWIDGAPLPPAPDTKE